MSLHPAENAVTISQAHLQLTSIEISASNFVQQSQLHVIGHFSLYLEGGDAIQDDALQEQSKHLKAMRKEVKMKRLNVIGSMALLSLILISSISFAEMAKEGSGDYRSVKTGTVSVLPMGEERVQMNFEEIGVVVGAPENCPLFNASFRDIGTLHAIKGKSIVTGSIEFTIPNGDKVYGTINAEGVLAQGGSTGIVEFVGGTGTCTGISGTIAYKPGAQVKPAKEGTYQTLTVGKMNWKIP